MSIPKEYWAQRAAKTQAALTEKSIKDTEKQLVKYFQATMNNVIGQFQETYMDILSSIEEGRAPTPADLYKLDKYWKMQGAMKVELEKLGNKTAKLLSKQFMDEYENIYKAFAITDDLFFQEFDRQAAQLMINQIWCADGKSWSSRIWTNTEKLQEALNEGLLDCLITGKQTKELKQRLVKEFDVAFNRADRLVRTEMAHIQTQAARQRYLDSGISEVEVWADKDERRCEVCGELHMKRYSIYDVMPIPAHSNCRCAIIPVVEVD